MVMGGVDSGSQVYYICTATFIYKIDISLPPCPPRYYLLSCICLIFQFLVLVLTLLI
jgi:hypothetical protein